MTRLNFLLAAILACGVAQAQAYRWVDKDGKVRYSDVPPAGAKAKELKAPPPPPAAATPDPASKDKAAKKGPLTPAEQEQAYRERQAKTKEAHDKAEKESAAAEVRKQNCASAQESLRSLEAGRRISSINAQGETVVLDEAAIQERTAQARKSVAENCK